MAVLDISIGMIWFMISTTYLIQSWVFLRIYRAGRPIYTEIEISDEKEKGDEHYGTKISSDEWQSITGEG